MNHQPTCPTLAGAPPTACDCYDEVIAAGTRNALPNPADLIRQAQQQGLLTPQPAYF